MSVTLRHDIPDSRGTNPKEHLHFVVGSEGRFLSGFELTSSITAEGPATILTPILRDGRRSSAYAKLPSDTEKIREIGRAFLDFADKLDAERFDY